MTNIQNNKSAFTLAEILITMVIIGVIAAITVPIVITNVQKEQTVTKLKKISKTLIQATDMIMMEEGTPKGGWGSDVDKIYEAYKKHLNILKDCGSESGCFAPGVVRHLKHSGSWAINDSTALRKIILSDGTPVAFEVYSVNCPSAYGSNNVCATIVADLNGFDKPNQAGRDVFRFALKENGLYPMGCDSDENYCDAEGKYGWGCACKVLYEEKINY